MNWTHILLSLTVSILCFSMSRIYISIDKLRDRVLLLEMESFSKKCTSELISTIRERLKTYEVDSVLQKDETDSNNEIH